MSETSTSKQRVVIKVISLLSSLDRRRLVTTNLDEQTAIPWSFFDAMRQDSPCTFSYSKELALKGPGRELSPAEIGATKSHLSVIEEFVKNDEAEWLFVLEDDVWVDPAFDFLAVIDYIESKKLGHLRFYARWWKPYDVLEYWGERQLVRFRTDPYGAQGYLINQTAAKRFLSTITHIYRPPDDHLGMFYLNGLDIYAIFPFPLIERAVPSTLATKRNEMVSVRPKGGLSNVAYRMSHKLRKIIANLIFRLTHKTMP